MLQYPAITKKGGQRLSPTGRVLWCGPFIVALLLGIDYDEAYRILLADVRRATAEAIRSAADQDYAIAKPSEVKQATSRINITGTYPHQVARLLTKRGVKTVFNHLDGKRPTLLALTRAMPDKTLLLNAGDHWIVVHEGVMYQSHYGPVAVEKAPTYRMSRVKSWAEVKPRPEAFC